MIEWCGSGWQHDAYFANFNGIKIDVSYRGGEWLYLVQPNSNRCEYRETFSIGFRPTRDAAMAQAEEDALEADRTYQTIVYS